MNNHQPTLLLVDDDPINLEILIDHLEGAGYQTVSAMDGGEAWGRLEQEPDRFDAVLLDRMMPVMNGMEVLAKIKANGALDFLPVIMQTAAGSPEEVRQGIEAGAFYYLTKPFTKEVVLAIVRAAVRDYAKVKALHRELAEQTRIFLCLDSAKFHFRTMEEAHILSLLLANACPDPGRVVLGLTELMVNAIEHGNLQITYEEKSRLQAEGAMDVELTRRLSLPEFAQKNAQIAFLRNEKTIEFTITDQGVGFDWTQYLDMSPDRGFATHGRGIALARALSFDSIEYQGVGNQLMCVVALP